MASARLVLSGATGLQRHSSDTRFSSLRPPGCRRVEDGRGSLGHAASPVSPSALIKPDVRTCRVAQPLLLSPSTDPIVRRYCNALQDGLELDESTVPGLMEARFGQWEGGQD